jgi:hypothetical protein
VVWLPRKARAVTTSPPLAQDRRSPRAGALLFQIGTIPLVAKLFPITDNGLVQASVAESPSRSRLFGNQER